MGVIDVDLGRLTRQKAAIDQTLTIEAGPTSATALGEALARYREQVLAALPDELREEFSEMFPLGDPPRGSGWSGFNPVQAMAEASRYHSLLLGMSGWLGSYIESVR